MNEPEKQNEEKRRMALYVNRTSYLPIYGLALWILCSICFLIQYGLKTKNEKMLLKKGLRNVLLLSVIPFLLYCMKCLPAETYLLPPHGTVEQRGMDGTRYITEYEYGDIMKMTTYRKDGSISSQSIILHPLSQYMRDGYPPTIKLLCYDTKYFSGYYTEGLCGVAHHEQYRLGDQAVRKTDGTLRYIERYNLQNIRTVVIEFDQNGNKVKEFICDKEGIINTNELTVIPPDLPILPHW